jgi:hypothetical protein
MRDTETANVLQTIHDRREVTHVEESGVRLHSPSVAAANLTDFLLMLLPPPHLAQSSVTHRPPLELPGDGDTSGTAGSLVAEESRWNTPAVS